MIQNLHGIIRLIEGEWRDKRVFVVGDIMLDRYVWGDVDRISPEAPVPVVRALHRSEQPGGAGNVAMNIAGLGAKATLFGFCGRDAEQGCLEKCLNEAGIDVRITSVSSHPTTTKLRILGGRQQMLRLDMERIGDYPAQSYDELIANVEDELSSANAVILSDYAKGTLTEEVCQRIISTCSVYHVPVLVDPKQHSFTRYRGAMMICPNLAELSRSCGVALEDLEALLSAGQKMVPDLHLECLTVTMSAKGIAVLRAESKFVAPAVARQVFDVSGAGDTVIATLALSVASSLEIDTAVQLANVAAGIVVSKVGTVPVNRDELLTTLMPEIGLQAQEKVLLFEQLRIRATAWRSGGQSIVFTNGCFDLLHIGHITLLEDARREGDRLIVAINSDASVHELKGPQRPIVGERERARILAALSVVDAVVIFNEATPLRLIEALRPDVLVKGGDYTEETVVGAHEARAWGGRVKLVPIVEGFSTTELISRAGVSEVQ